MVREELDLWLGSHFQIRALLEPQVFARRRIETTPDVGLNHRSVDHVGGIWHINITETFKYRRREGDLEKHDFVLIFSRLSWKILDSWSRFRYETDQMEDCRHVSEEGSGHGSTAGVLQSRREVFARLELVVGIHRDDDHAQHRLVGVWGHRSSQFDWKKKNNSR